MSLADDVVNCQTLVSAIASFYECQHSKSNISKGAFVRPGPNADCETGCTCDLICEGHSFPEVRVFNSSFGSLLMILLVGVITDIFDEAYNWWVTVHTYLLLPWSGLVQCECSVLLNIVHAIAVDGREGYSVRRPVEDGDEVGNSGDFITSKISKKGRHFVDSGRSVQKSVVIISCATGRIRNSP
jgi:hypothetical protein